MRLFVGLWPDALARENLWRCLKSLSLRGRSTHPEDLHVTLQFLGEVAAERLPCVEDAVAALAGRGSFDLLLDQAGYWPRPRVSWLAPSEVPAPLLALQQDLAARLNACGFPPEARPYRPHVTLARKSPGLLARRIEQPLLWRVSQVALVASGGAGPPRYRPLRLWSLEISTDGVENKERTN